MIYPATLLQRYRVMSEKPNRSWQDIATEAYREQNPERRRQLSEELELCLEERAKQISLQKLPESPKTRSLLTNPSST